MIQNDRHRLTGRPQVSVACDKDACPESQETTQHAHRYRREMDGYERCTFCGMRKPG